MTTLIIVLLSVMFIFACWKWFKWKVAAMATIAFMVDKFREPTEAERKLYSKFVVRHLLKLR